MSFGDFVSLAPRSQPDVLVDLYVTDCKGTRLSWDPGFPPRARATRYPVGDLAVVCIAMDGDTGAGIYELDVAVARSCLQDDAGSGRDASPAAPVTIGQGTIEGCLSTREGQWQNGGTSSYSKIGDKDSFVLPLEAGEEVVVALELASAVNGRLSAYGPGGALLASETVWLSAGHALIWTATATGDHVLHLEGGATTYALTVRPPVAACAPQNDAAQGVDAGSDAAGALTVPPGLHAGCLDETDGIDRYAVAVSAGDVLEVSATLDSPLPWTLALVDAQGRTLSSANSGGSSWRPFQPVHVVRTVALSDGHVGVVIGVGRTGTTYTLDVGREATGAIPMQPLAAIPGAAHVEACAGGVRVSGDTLWHVEPDGTAAPVRDDFWSPTPLACDADGRVFGNSGKHVYRIRPFAALGHAADGEPVRFMGEGTGALALSADGVLWSADYVDDTIRAMDCTSREVLVRGAASEDFVWDLAFHPDGTLYAAAGEHVRPVDPATGTLGPSILTLPQLRALEFDSAGGGYVLSAEGMVHRFDPATGGAEPFAAAGPDARSLALAGSVLHATAAGRLMALDVGVAGSADAPSCGTLVPDIAVVDVELVAESADVAGASVDTATSTTRTVRVTIENQGETTFHARYLMARLEATVACNVARCGIARDTTYSSGWTGPDGRGSIWVSLAPGEQATTTLTWTRATSLGDYDVRVWLESQQGYADHESDLTNNELTRRLYARIGGLGGIT